MFLNNTQRKSLKLSEATVGLFEAAESPEEKCVESSHESPDDEDSVSIGFHNESDDEAVLNCLD